MQNKLCVEGILIDNHHYHLSDDTTSSSHFENWLIFNRSIEPTLKRIHYSIQKKHK